MPKSKDEIAEIIVAHLLDIEAGQCSITDEAIAREEDQPLREILTGLMYLHEDLILKEDQRKQAEDKLSESEKTLKTILNTTTDAMFMIDTAGNILALNETTALMLDKKPDELIGTCIYDYLPPDLARSRRAHVNETIRSGKAVRFDEERNGEAVDNSISPIFDEKGKVVKLAIYGRYITERKLAEFELRNAYQELENTQNASLNIMVDLDREADERRRAEAEVRKLNDGLEQKVMARTAALEQASRGKDEFLAAISHELRTPLNHILGFSDLLKEGLAGELSAEQREMAQHIFDAGNRQLAIVNSLIELARLQAGKAKLYARMEEPARLLGEIAKLHVERALKAGLDFTVELEQGRGEMPLDREVVTHLLEQLLSNAFKFTQAGGKVRLTSHRVPRADVSAPVLVEADEYLELCVADNGPGIAPEILPRLFQPFVQGDGRLNRNYQGTGIGLVLVRLLAELHGGGIGVESRPGIGTKFMVWLPCKEMAETPCQLPAA